MTFSSEIKPLHIGAGVLAVLALIAGLAAWYKPTLPALPTNTYTEAPAQPKAGAVPKVDVEVKKVKVIPKGTAVKVIKDLPPEVATDDNTEVTNTATTGPSKAGVDIVTVINKETGETKILAKEKSRSLIEFLNEKRIGLAYGITTDNGQQFGKVFGEWTFLRVGSVHVGVQADIRAKQFGNAEGTAVAVVDYRW